RPVPIRRRILEITAAAGIAGAAVWGIGHRRAEKPAYTGHVSRMTYSGGLTIFPALSADGKLPAYASDRAGHGNLEVWPQQVGGGGAAVQLTSDEADDSQPSFSPDGTTVAFRSERDGGAVFSMPVLGGTEKRLLAKSGRNPAYSPDGRWLAYWVGEAHLL